MSLYGFPVGEHYYYADRTHQEIMATFEKVKMLEAQIERVRKLHERVGNTCLECADNGWGEWPCPTIRALDGENA